MFRTLRNAFKIKDIQKQAFLYLHDAGRNPAGVSDSGSWCRHGVTSPTGLHSRRGDAFNFFNAFTGGSFEQMSIFALNITPYITSSIIIQLLTIAIPKLEEMQRDGEDGRKKLTAITRYVTIGLALIESTAMAIGFGRSGLIEEFNALNVLTRGCRTDSWFCIPDVGR